MNTIILSGRLASWVGMAVLLLSSPARSAGPPPSAARGRSFRVSPTPRLTVHEWGTFTAVQDEQGRALAGINTDDQPVPKFVHRLADYLLIAPGDLAPVFFKGAPRCHPDVTLRLETPVLYFYPPTSAALPMTASVRVSFKNGWLTEFYPNAAADAPGLKQHSFDFGPLGPGVNGSLSWSRLRIGDEPPGPATDWPVWLAPRQVRSAGAATESGESERYLFYRGVAHLNAPLRVSRDVKDGELTVRAQADSVVSASGPLDFQRLWLVDVRTDGAVAYRRLPALGAGRALRLAAGFEAGAYAVGNLQALTGEMQGDLVRAGLYPDEAQALLRTWEAAYFKSPGARLFFLVPRAWTDAALPLDVASGADVTRVMVGRIELVTPDQRRLLRRIAELPTTQNHWLWQAVDSRGGDAWQALFRGEKSLRELGISVPPEYQAYLDLGRFRNALILDEQQRHPSGNLSRFAREYELGYFQIPVRSVAAGNGP